MVEYVDSHVLEVPAMPRAAAPLFERQAAVRKARFQHPFEACPKAVPALAHGEIAGPSRQAAWFDGHEDKVRRHNARASNGFSMVNPRARAESIRDAPSRDGFLCVVILVFCNALQLKASAIQQRRSSMGSSGSKQPSRYLIFVSQNSHGRSSRPFSTLPEPGSIPHDPHHLKEQTMPTFQLFRPKVIQWSQIKIKLITQALHVEL